MMQFQESGVLSIPWGEEITPPSSASSNGILAVALPTSTMGRDLETLMDTRAQRRLFIGRDPSICGGAPIIRGTRISVARIVEIHHFLGWDLDQIREGYPHLNHDQIKAALEFYGENALEIDKLLQEEQEINAG